MTTPALVGRAREMRVLAGLISVRALYWQPVTTGYSMCQGSGSAHGGERHG